MILKSLLLFTLLGLTAADRISDVLNENLNLARSNRDEAQGYLDSWDLFSNRRNKLARDAGNDWVSRANSRKVTPRTILLDELWKDYEHHAHLEQKFREWGGHTNGYAAFIHERARDSFRVTYGTIKNLMVGSTIKCETAAGSKGLIEKLRNKINQKQETRKLVPFLNAVMGDNSNAQNIISSLAQEIARERTERLNLWTSTIAASHAQRCYGHKTLESWSVTKNISELQNLLTTIMKEHCADVDHNNPFIPKQIWNKFSSMWDQVSAKFVKQSMQNMLNQDDRNQGKDRRVYKMMLAYPVDKPMNQLLDDQKTFWRAELPEIFNHLCQHKTGFKSLEVTFFKVHGRYDPNDRSEGAFIKKIKDYLARSCFDPRIAEIKFYKEDYKLYGDFDEEKAAIPQASKSQCSKLIEKV